MREPGQQTEFDVEDFEVIAYSHALSDSTCE
jgi:hypothetical protein